MNLDQLRAFHTVTQYGTISRATSALALTQSAVSRQLQALEAEVGARLFTREGRTMTLTEAGRLLLEHADLVFGAITRAREAIDGLQGLERGHLRVGAASTIGTYLLPPLLGRFKTTRPGVDVTLEVANKAQTLERLRRGHIELGFVGPRVLMDDFEQEPYLTDDLGLITAPSHPLAHARRVMARDLTSEVFITREPGSGTREIVEEELSRARVELRRLMEVGSTEAIKQAVAANLGVSIVSRYAVVLETQVKRLCFTPIADLKLTRQLFVIYRRRRPLSHAGAAFLELLRTVDHVAILKKHRRRRRRS